MFCISTQIWRLGICFETDGFHISQEWTKQGDGRWKSSIQVTSILSADTCESRSLQSASLFRHVSYPAWRVKNILDTGFQQHSYTSTLLPSSSPCHPISLLPLTSSPNHLSARPEFPFSLSRCAPTFAPCIDPNTPRTPASLSSPSSSPVHEPLVRRSLARGGLRSGSRYPGPGLRRVAGHILSQLLALCSSRASGLDLASRCAGDLLSERSLGSFVARRSCGL